MTWICTVCGEPSRLTVPEPMLGNYGSARCLVCKKKRIFKEVSRDTRPNRLAEGHQDPTPDER